MQSSSYSRQHLLPLPVILTVGSTRLRAATSQTHSNRHLATAPISHCIRSFLLIAAMALACRARGDSVTLDDHGTAPCYLYTNDRADSALMHVTVVTGNVWNHDDSSLYDDLRVRDAAGIVFITGMHVPYGAPAGTIVTEFDYVEAYPLCNLPPGNTSTWGFPVQCFLGGSGIIRGSAVGSGLVSTFTNSGDGGYTGSGLGVRKTVGAQTWIIYDGPAAVPPPEAYIKSCDVKSGGDGGKNCASCGMARYSAHSLLASLNIEDTPIGYSPPRGPAINFTVTYNQREAQQPQTFTYSNLGPKWTFNWLSYVTDDPNNPAGNAAIYVAGGGGENYSGFDSGSQTYLPEPTTAPTAFVRLPMKLTRTRLRPTTTIWIVRRR